ncbi:MULTISPECIES: DUF1810 domain-containing protein [Bradyrhizobium]|jgi:uncharacterized protein (DUF1810 family)|uniref:DUF1810 domain-containing protein n=1 Tax=Bradyrhizobium ottawaense TaxID=931866 RepID=A0A2U8PF62_9BRAD|nr:MULTISPECIES: DUF1810 domain-containing protein [Bradyrhizobium]AWL96412.1 DUF1810 domain-containing protein [Bradyrhizobium ottawaense]MBR1363877.1 DUF1810 domain-containing protein [Bradyrhizobium ottawaense]MDA9452616.1 calpastatin [Bradyrhizobium sp. CCBAU 21360]MDA9457481.1 calpastatin [Bradyrhizobium sp. CCBAU 21359]MDA9475677.1 calpastatin [Bradyrhizobium sp. CCBAU 65884]
MTDPFDLERFVTAQNTVFRDVQGELARGRKQTHWMWFVFPQIAGLGFSAMSQRYAIGSRAEAKAYLAHPVLGPRLVECTRLVLAVDGRTINAILGAPDDAKFRSSMTLFGAVSDEPVFGEALARYFAGERDAATLEILSKLDRQAPR